jgi:hypothetical protein
MVRKESQMKEDEMRRKEQLMRDQVRHRYFFLGFSLVSFVSGSSVIYLFNHFFCYFCFCFLRLVSVSIACFDLLFLILFAFVRIEFVSDL